MKRATGNLRVIAGSAKGRRLASPEGHGTRPPTGLIRNAIFNILGGRVDGARVLDLYAGSGSLGIEALSRGAASAAFIEIGREALACLEENLRTLRFEKTGRVLRGDARKAIDRFAADGAARFDVIFVDYPFRQLEGPGGRETLEAIVTGASGLLPPAGVQVVRVPKEWIPRAPGKNGPDIRIYGPSAVLFLGAGETFAFEAPSRRMSGHRSSQRRRDEEE